VPIRDTLKAPSLEHGSAFPPRDAPEVCCEFVALFKQREQCYPKRGAGNAGRSTRPQPCVQKWKARKQVTTVTPKTPGIPAQWF
jgi:hypothetical protein